MKRLLFLIMLTASSSVIFAQQVIDKPQLFKRVSPYERYTTYRVSLTNGLAMPMGTLGDFMDKNTLRNYTAAVDFVFPKNNLSIGATFGWQYFKNRLPRKTYNFDDGDISAVQTRTVTIYPFMLTGSYHFTKATAPIRPYVQVGLGAAFADIANYWGMIPTGANGFKMVAQAGAGVRALFKKEGNFGLELGANYQYIPYDLPDENLKQASSLNVRAGIFYRWW